LTYLKNCDRIEQQALKQGDILEHMRIHGAQHDDTENELCIVFTMHFQYMNKITN
jgi:hypothetical protein